MASAIAHAASKSERRPRVRSIRAEGIVAALMLAGVAIGLHTLGAKSLWLDETYSLRYATGSSAVFWHAVSRDDPNMSLYYLLLRGWVALFGSGAATARSLSVLAAVLAVPVVYAVGRRLAGRLEGIVAALLLAVNAFFVSYAQTARAYALVVLLVALSCYFFAGELENPSRRGAIAYVLTTTLSFYAHYFSAFVVLVQVLTVIAVHRRAAFSRRWIVMVGLVAVLCAPEAYAAVVAGPQGIFWIAQPNLRDLASFAAALSGGDRVLAVILFALAGFGAVMAVRGGGRRAGAPRWKVGFLVAWLGVPVALAFILSFVQPIFAFHYLLVTMPAFVVLSAVGIVRLGRRAGVVALIAVVGLSVHSVLNWYDQPSREDFRAAAAYLTAHAKPADRLLVWPVYASTALSYYLDRAPGGASAAAFVPHGRLSGDPPRLWLVIRDFEVTLTPGRLKAFEDTFDRRYKLVSTARFSGVTELGYRRNG